MSSYVMNVGLIAQVGGLFGDGRADAVVGWALALVASGLVGLVGVMLRGWFRTASCELFPTIAITSPDAGRSLRLVLAGCQAINGRRDGEAKPALQGFKAGELAKLWLGMDDSITHVRLVDQQGRRLFISSARALPYDACVKVVWADSMILAVVIGCFNDGQKYGVVLEIHHFLSNLSELRRVVVSASDLAEHDGRLDKAA